MTVTAGIYTFDSPLHSLQILVNSTLALTGYMQMRGLTSSLILIESLQVNALGTSLSVTYVRPGENTLITEELYHESIGWYSNFSPIIYLTMDQDISSANWSEWWQANMIQPAPVAGSYLTSTNVASMLQYAVSTNPTSQLVRIRVLNSSEATVAEIAGIVTAGSISIDAKSIIRRTGSITIEIPSRNLLSIDLQQILKIGNLIEIDIGNNNYGTDYIAFPEFWFKLGQFVVDNPAFSYSAQGLKLSMSLKDKIARLNGEYGGIFAAATELSDYSDHNGAIQSVKLYTLLKQLLIDIGHIPPEKIIIDDVPDQICNIVRWGDTAKTLYQLSNKSLTVAPDAFDQVQTNFQYGDVIGYVYTDFTYPGRLTAQAGETVTSVLDKIKTTCGNYEYFFDAHGVFHFQAIKDNSLYGSALDNFEDALIDAYFTPKERNPVIWSFTDSSLVHSYANNPQLKKIKNDIVYWGMRSNKQPIRYHVILDAALPDKEYYWYTQNGQSKVSDTLESVTGAYRRIVPKDPRNKLYFSYLVSGDTSSLATEMLLEWPKIYDVFMERFIVTPQEANYFLDFIDTTSLLGVPNIAQFSITQIGKLQSCLSNDKINCLFATPEPTEKTVYYLENTTPPSDVPNTTSLIPVSQEIWQAMLLGKIERDAYSEVRSALHEYLSYNNAITLTTTPLYFLDVNKLIHVDNEETNIAGQYLITTIQFSLAEGGKMTINATKAVERI